VAGPPDLILAGDVYTVDAARRWAEAVAVRGGRIVAVGPAPEVLALAGPATRTVELPGHLILPGFQDAHVHPPAAGLAGLRCDLHGRSDAAGYLDAVAGYARTHPDRPWIVGEGWAMSAFPGGRATRQALDAAVSDRPVFLETRDGHSAWVNTRALGMAGVTRDTPDPPGGRIERDDRGDPAGTLQERAMELVGRLLPATSQADWEQAIRVAQAELHGLGVTAWQDAAVPPETLAAYRGLAGRGELTARVTGSLQWDPDRGEDQVADLIEQRALGDVGRLRATSVKFFQDGVAENFTAAMLEDYLDAEGRASGNRGMSMIEPAALNRFVTRLDAQGFQVHVHGLGDRAVREALDAFEVARTANGARDSRHHIAHIQVVHPDDRPRFRRLGVVANGQPFWAMLDDYMRDLTLPFLGPERARWQYPFRSLLRAGAVLAFGSDWSVSTANPLLEMEVAVTRVSPEDRGAEPFLPEERLDLSQALAAFTMGSAFVNHLDHLAGSIEAGKLADIVVLDRNPFDPDAGPIGDAKVLLTLVEGEAVFADPSLGW
jgi:predicted amidohydrolase YtcJ